MYRIWAKTMRGDKITRNYLYTADGVWRRGAFRPCVYDICHELDIPSPVILPTHIANFEQFNHVRFRERDYVESIDFDAFVLEYCLDDDRPKKDLRLYP